MAFENGRYTYSRLSIYRLSMYGDYSTSDKMNPGNDSEPPPVYLVSAATDQSESTAPTLLEPGGSSSIAVGAGNLNKREIAAVPMAPPMTPSFYGRINVPYSHLYFPMGSMFNPSPTPGSGPVALFCNPTFPYLLQGQQGMQMLHHPPNYATGTNSLNLALNPGLLFDI